MKLEEKCEYLVRVESLYARAVESIVADIKDGTQEQREDAVSPGAVDRRFFDLVALDMRQQVENTVKTYDRKIREIKQSVSSAVKQVNQAFIPQQPVSRGGDAQAAAEGLCG